MKRKYSVTEIDALREVCERRFDYGFSVPMVPRFRWRGGVSYNESDRANRRLRYIEENTRTFMLAGKTAEDIIAADAITAGPINAEAEADNAEYREQCAAREAMASRETSTRIVGCTITRHTESSYTTIRSTPEGWLAWFKSLWPF